MKRSEAMIRVQFIKDAHLPRFVMKDGEHWDFKKDKLTESGFPIGGGWATQDFYKVIPR